MSEIMSKGISKVQNKVQNKAQNKAQNKEQFMQDKDEYRYRPWLFFICAYFLHGYSGYRQSLFPKIRLRY